MAGAAKQLGLAGVAVSIGVAIGHLMTSVAAPAAPAAPAAAGQSAEVELLEARLAALSGQVSALQRSGRAAPAPAAVAPDEPRQEPAEDGDAPAPAPAISDDERAARMAVALETEPLDASWSATKEREIRDALDQDALRDAHLVDIACRSSMCRVVLDFDNEDEQLAVLTELPMDPAFEAGGFIRYTGSPDAPRAELFIARRGADLPAFD